ncbi:MAG: hypothetical protein KJS77_05190 [Planctomycetes bacterium]|nr:hypothetical protein [Planctomycetota bacterium]
MTDRAHQPNPPHAAGGAAGDPDEVAVDAEWRKIEAERIAEEREEAREDEREANPPSRRWSWGAFAAALAAGLILAMALNWPLNWPGVLSQRGVPPPEADAPADVPPPGDRGPDPARLEE